MDPVDALSKPTILEHLPIFIALVAVIGISLTFIIKKLIDAYNAAREFVAHAIDEKLPQAVISALEEKAAGIFDRIVKERLERHEEVEEVKMQNALQSMKNTFESERIARDGKLNEGITSIMDKLSGVDNRLQVVQIRIESHDARIRAVEEVVQPLRSPPKPRPKKKKKR